MKSAITKRRSVRSYENSPLSNEDASYVQTLVDEFNHKTGPFGHTVHFFFVENNTTKNTKIGTYGFIKNPPAFIGGVVSNTTMGMIDVGFLMEQMILQLTAHNLGTVWLGGTYHRSDFDVEVNHGEIIAAVSPVGYPTTTSIRERVIRKVAKADTRKPFNELFFQGRNCSPLNTDHPYYDYLSFVRIAPSASNKQPWRIIIIDNVLHLYLARTPHYGNALKFDIQAIDIGIALSHLTLTLQESGHSVILTTIDPQLDVHWEYIISVQVTDTNRS